jgi:mannose-6-phosphate isomerase-like protein (cupin superfamily)
MPRKQLSLRKGFSVALTSKRAQAATMLIAPGDTEGGPDNAHGGADQWLFVLAGTGVGILPGRTYSLKAKPLLLIERGVKHEIRNTGRTPLRTLNIYVPPAYKRGGDELPRGRKER